MFANTMSAAIDAARTLTQLDHSRAPSGRRPGPGQIATMRRSTWLSSYKPVGASYAAKSSRWAFHLAGPRSSRHGGSQRAPVRAVAIARRRHLAASGPMPPALASKFTVSELAVLRIVGDEVRGQGACDRTVDEIAARAGTCRTVVKDAIRARPRLGLLTVQERRRQGQKNLPNVVRIVSREWTQWLARGPKSGRPMVPKPIGVGNFTPTDSRQRKEGAPSAQRAVRKRGAAAFDANDRPAVFGKPLRTQMIPDEECRQTKSRRRRPVGPVVIINPGPKRNP